MKHASYVNILIVICFWLMPSVSLAQPTEENLVQAWENIQQTDPKNEVFEKIGKNTYKFKTKWFPFDGSLRILNVTIDDRNKHIPSMYNYTMGVVEVELIDLPNDFTQKHSYSYSLWAGGNMLYYVGDDNKWVTYNELFDKKESEYKGDFTGGFLSIIADNLFLIVFILVLIPLLLIITKKQQKRYQRYLDNSEEKINKSFELNQESLELTKESLDIQKKILAHLKK